MMISSLRLPRIAVVVAVACFSGAVLGAVIYFAFAQDALRMERDLRGLTFEQKLCQSTLGTWSSSGCECSLPGATFDPIQGCAAGAAAVIGRDPNEMATSLVSDFLATLQRGELISSRKFFAESFTPEDFLKDPFDRFEIEDVAPISTEDRTGLFEVAARVCRRDECSSWVFDIVRDDRRYAIGAISAQ
jgi:hypothetical protein